MSWRTTRGGMCGGARCPAQHQRVVVQRYGHCGQVVVLDRLGQRLRHVVLTQRPSKPPTPPLRRISQTPPTRLAMAHPRGPYKHLSQEPPHDHPTTQEFRLPHAHNQQPKSLTPRRAPAASGRCSPIVRLPGSRTGNSERCLRAPTETPNAITSIVDAPTGGVSHSNADASGERLAFESPIVVNSMGQHDEYRPIPIENYKVCPHATLNIERPRYHCTVTKDSTAPPRS